MARRRTNTRKERQARAERFIQSPWQAVQNRLPPIEILSADEIETVHLKSLEILQEIGIRVESEKALTVLKEAGADVNFDTQMVRFDSELVESVLPLCPSHFTVRARDPKKELTFGGNNIVYSATTGPAFLNSMEHGRRPGTYEDSNNFIKLVQMMNIIHHEGGNGMEPLDLPKETRYLDMMFSQCTLTDKTWHPCWKNSADQATDICNMACISLGVTREELAQKPGVVTGIPVNTPLVIDDGLAEAVMELARWKQPCVIQSFPLSGAMTPATLAATLILQNAEVLAGFVLIQSVSPGCPVIYGSFPCNVDLKSGSPLFGTPEGPKLMQAGAQMARRYGVPYQCSAPCASNAVDAQAAYETMMSLWGTVMSHTNVLRHAAGWLEGGLSCSFEKFILDVEMVQMMTEYLKPIRFDDSSINLDVIRNVGPGGHFLGEEDTLSRYETAFYSPIVSDSRNFEAWTADGAKTATQRANGIWKELLANYEKPYMDPAVEEELADYVARRKIEINKSCS